jgi:hypothetical protein
LVNVALAFFGTVISAHAYNSKVLLDKVTIETAEARIQLKEIKKKLDSEQWAAEVMHELRPFATLSIEDAGNHLHKAIQKKLDDDLEMAKAPDGPMKPQIGMI